MATFSAGERAYLDGQKLGRLATVDGKGQPQANPVGFVVREDGAIDIGGYAMGTTKKWRNIAGNPLVSLIVDDIVSHQPWMVRGIEIRGEAEQVTGAHDLGAHLSPEVIRIRPRRIISWGIEGGESGMRGRTVSEDAL
ncbi:PPOX class F420-dependent oxidoreductase [Streptomyces sp. H10-C2]|uniref:PPOX class F420-dependent oxidoreductase n=1 Tax=unclassified Streptomyces TaxID=2593676 RepID=UPI0024BA99A9|nr:MULTISPECIES: PPOX class F420-dependent oxidoreductase [unclassified Streptomyces]MDJ0340732.1 PPOX class F420-dependent oxidoreductase [Streptomyces sp. PH10-H1]MDJ0371996.1 PPOX class F420-dependent oxidoreductase [Streptomyces sp. H10-C2]